MKISVLRGSMLVALLLWALLEGTAGAWAQDPGGENRAGLVVVGAAGEVVNTCVAFAEPEINGYELLSRAGLAVQAEQAAMGMTVCSLEGTGCDFPAESCFCQCLSSPCVYWSYWEQDEAGTWTYSNAGASNTRVRDGGIQGWVWGESTAGTAPEPPATSFDEICVAPLAEVSTSLPTPAAAENDVPEVFSSQEAEQLDWITPLGVGLIVLLPLAAFAIFGRRRGSVKRAP